MTVAAPSDVQPSEPTADTSNGVPVRTASAVWILIAGVVGLAAALTLTIEKIEILINPDYVPSCSINPVLSCGSVMVTPQASAFGFPNPLIGIVSFTVVVVTGVLAVAHVRLPRWYWAGLAIGTLLGVAFIHWLIFQSLYRIGALCPYCMVVWIVTIPIFWYVTLANLEAGRIPLPGSVRRAASWATRYHTVVLTLWMLAIAGLILQRFWYYWITLI